MACTGSDSPCAVAGDDFYYDIQFTEEDEITPIDLTGSVALMDLRDSAVSASVVQAMSGGITDAFNGWMRFYLTDAQTAALLDRAEATRTLTFSIKITYSDATKETILIGTLLLEQVATA